MHGLHDSSSARRNAARARDRHDRAFHAPDLPPTAIGQVERRLQKRAQDQWHALRDEGGLPLAHAFLLSADPYMAARSVLFDLGAHRNDPAIGWLGQVVREGMACAAQGEAAAPRRAPQTLSQALECPLLGKIAQACAAQPLLREPATVSGRSMRACDGGGLVWRAVLLPLAGSDGAVAQVLAVLDWR
ncbi:MAG TPA: hypothetical protein VN222_09060, partial [Novosphingobium sp.]|nr:hypothetical protein [Novosphingobium sp.]